MAEKPKYSSIIDEFLDSREPNWKDLGLKDAKDSGNEWLDRTHNEADEKFMDEIAEGVSHHTNVPPTSKGATLQNRLLDKENATPRLGAALPANTRNASSPQDYRSPINNDDDSLLNEVTESFEAAEKSAPVEKKDRSDAEIKRYVHQLLNQGVEPAKVAAQLKKLAEIELFNHQLGTRYLQDNAGLLGMAYMEPNTFMDKNNPSYGRKTPKVADYCSRHNRNLTQGAFDALCPDCEHEADNAALDYPTKNPRLKELDALSMKYYDRPFVELDADMRMELEQELDDATPFDMHSSSSDCVRQATAWKSVGITPRAKSVKQVSACEDCSYFSKNGAAKTCNLYHLPVVSNSTELGAVVNRMTAGVPKNLKKAALVQIANRTPEHVSPVKTASIEAPFVHQASFTHERAKGFIEQQHFSGAQVQKLHTAGHSLKKIVAAAEKRFGVLEASKGLREFVASLRKEKGKIILAKADADYLKKVGIHSDVIVGAAKCASCKDHNGKEIQKAASTEMVTRAVDNFVETTPEHVRASQHKTASNFDSAVVAKLHAKGHSVDKILKAASIKFGSAQASKAVRDWARNLKHTNTKIALSQIDCTVLSKMGVKLGSQNAIVGAAKCGSCGYRHGMHCGLTGGTLLSFPGMNQAAVKKAAPGAPVDGRAMLKEYDLTGKVAQADIDLRTDRTYDVKFSANHTPDPLHSRGATPSGFYVDGKAWDSVPPQRPGYYDENPPDDWEDCGQCGGYHPAGYSGDCRSDINRWPSEEAIAAMEGTKKVQDSEPWDTLTPGKGEEADDNF